MDSGTFEENLRFTSGAWHLTAQSYPSVGAVHLYRDAKTHNQCRTVSSICDIVSPDNFYLFVTTFISGLLKAADFIVQDMSEVRSYLNNLLQALSAVYVPYIEPSATWSDYTDFDPYEYLRDKYNVAVSTFPKASVADCKSPEDCDKLYSELKELFRN